MARATTATRRGRKQRGGRGRSRPANRSRRLTEPSRTRAAFADQLGGHAFDALALALIAAAALLTLALASDLAGPIGRGLDRGITALLGRGAFLVPLALATTAVLLFRPKLAAAIASDDEEDEEEVEPPAGLRIGFGVTLVLLSIAGLLHLTGGDPAFDAPVTKLRDAGGYIGAAIGRPLVSGLGDAGAAIVLSCVLLLGLLVAPGLSMAQVFRGLATLTRHAGHIVAKVFSLHEPDEPVADTTAAVEAPAEPAPPARRKSMENVVLYDYDVETEPAEDEVEGEDDAEEEEEEEYEEEDDEEYEEYDEDEEWDEEDDEEEEEDEEAEDDLEIEVAAPHPDWKLPTNDLLKRSNSKGVDPRLAEAGGEVLEATLKDFGVDARLIGMTVGPTVTRYELELAPGVKVNRVTGLSHDIAYAMASPDVRILAPIPGRSAIGVEVPNKQRQLVTLGDILSSDEAEKATHPLEVGLGRDISGRPAMLDLATMPHVLIAGQTGAGKSSCINSLITSILMRCTPEQVRLILVDPKRVELGQYDGLPHLLTEVVTNPKKAANALDWAVREMELRYDLLAEVGVRDITGYNAMYDRGALPTEENPDPHGGKTYARLPYIVVVVDELNDLMMVAARDVEASICRIAQMARAVGIHLVIATQRPSVNVITGVIKANVPSRLAFKVTSIADSRVILDQQGAEKLVGQGDMLLMSASSSKPVRIQGSWVDEECVRKVAAHWKRQVEQPQYVEGLQGDDSAGGAGGDDLDDDDELLGEAMQLVVRSGLGSTSMLQRKLRVGFARAGRIMDLLERKGVVGPSEGSKARAVLMTVDELEEMEART